MHTPEDLIQKTRDKVETVLKTQYPDHVCFDNESFSIDAGSSRVMIIIRPFTDNDTCIECMATLVTGANINEDLLRFLMRKNAELHFGAFSLMFDDTICFAHSIAGINADENEIITSIQSVALIADHYVDEIMTMAGGERCSEVSGI
jgi:hypothetical protein